MSSVRFDAPPAGIKDRELYAWLYRLSQDLQVALTSIDETNMTPEAAEAVSGGGAAQAAAKAEVQTSAATLRGLIVKTANEVRHEMDQIVQEFGETYVAQSDFGTFEQEITSTLTQSARDITYEILMDEKLTADPEDAQQIGATAEIEQLKAYRELTHGFIKQGFLGYDELGRPLIGIAIGQEVQTTGATVHVGTADYEVIADGQTMGVYTSQGLSFYQNGTEVAYMKDQKLYIREAKIAGNQEIGSWRWEQDAQHGLTLRYVGVLNNV